MRIVFAIAAILFFCAPVGLRMVGVTADPFENRRLADPPQLSAGWDAFDQTTRFFVDRLPLREEAVRANTWIALNVFDSPPDYGRGTAGGNTERDALPFGEPDSPEKLAAPPPPAGGPEGERTEVQPGVTVMRGRDGWLFLQEELNRACTPFVDVATAERRYERMVQIIRASGRDVVFAVPPDKSTIYPEYLPETYPDQECVATGRDALWDAVEGSKVPEILGLRQAMLEGKAPPPEHSYLLHDTHWGSKGALLGVAAVLDNLGTKVQIAEDDIVRERAKAPGDLANLLSAPEDLDVPSWRIERPLPEVATAEDKLPEGSVQIVDRRPAANVPLIPGRTVFVHDSFGVGMLGPLRAYTREFASLQWFLSKPNDILEAIAQGDTVVLEKVERDWNYLASDQGMVTPAFLDALEARLRREQ